MGVDRGHDAPYGDTKIEMDAIRKALAFDPTKMETDQMLQPLGGRDCVTGERIEVVHADDCRRIELQKLEQARELAEQSNELNEVIQILGRILTGEPTGIHIGHAADMARKVAEKFAVSETGPSVTGPDEYGSVYVRFGPKQSGVKTRTHTGITNLDYDKDGNLYGIELLSVARKEQA